jgi:tetratricopeptide (TPR) repeat protein
VIHPLQLRYDPALDAPPAAWFLPGDSVERWLEELARCGLAAIDTRLFVIPRSTEDHSAAGLLVVPARVESVRETPAGIGCRLVAGRVFVPTDAVLQPPVTDSELRHLCALPVSFFHPAFGLSGFEEEAVLRVSDLLEAPEERAANWNFARPGTPALPELSAIVLLQPPSIEDVFGGAQDEIGSEAPSDLPPAPDEPKEDPVTKARRTLKQLFARTVSETTRRLPHTGRRRTWVNAAEDWANRQLHGVSQQLERLRNKELHRLLHLLDTDPEAGLRHAIPMNRFAHRGVAPPGGRLGAHSLHFDPTRLGGGPADFWHVPVDLQEVLRRRYREMADREMQLGRHRRAAYIYAELLGDLVSAANAFKQGRLFREAALLYEEHLRNPLEAARCLAEGGFLAEAIERYDKLGRWLEVANLYERAGNPAEAEKAIRRVVQEHLQQNDVLGAARLVEERLRAPDEALEMLWQAWPGSRQGASCVAAAFKLLARLGRHEDAQERLAQLTHEPVPTSSQLLALVAMLGGAARDYPHERVRHGAADFSRVLIARGLQRPALPADDAGCLLDQLMRLAPQDRLLSRDAHRYLTERRSAELRVRRVTPPPLPGNKPVMHHRFELPRQIQWLQLRREGPWFFALGVTARRLTLLRGTWDGEYQSLSWDCPAEAVKQGFVFEPTAEQGRAVALARSDGPPLAQKRFPAADLFFNKACMAGTPTWLPTQGFPFAIGEDACWTVHLASGRAILSCCDKVRGQLQQTIDVTNELLGAAERTLETRLSLAVLANSVAVALGNRLVLTRPDGGLTRVELPGQAVRMFATIPNTRQGVAVMLQNGAVMYWLGANACLELDRDLDSPIGAFIPGGPLVLASGVRATLLEMDSRGVHNVVGIELTGRRAVGVSAAANPGEFAVLGEYGEMAVYRMAR